ncbi:ion transporter [Colwellia sp. 4_MG-2023]|jgi:voltage-gated sodium channel|uniref:ion transporter n=1 Tax=unclassified Colwellia TaxID=196834 RepID=UPI001C0A65FF|nr:MULTISPECIES: ion transporter [unclassified Colwellia]MBU2923906.1 ion transporter [Colwellia sp. C2M11]MDO6507633.1 ion transporter [Colwellia sp. 5_MG-2023]MDO6555629.1 ion transporter [Colwellia sp. 4_MG-2023]MDO6653022.1 ion transporter [Colwellia sp. 3_MG-2023]MDO6665991.1 ion transporter [Colwellia sp. 2_MG-2023]
MNSFIFRAQRRLKIIDSSKLFQGVVIAVILLSALLIGAKTHNLSANAMAVLTLLDLCITIFFVIEITIRFFAHQDKKQFFRSGWNVFDTFIVIGSLIPLGGSGVLLARLLRVFRVLRLVSMVPELRLLINSLLKAIPRMGYIALLMFVIFYIYAAVGSMYFHQINETLWGDVSISMLTLFRVATFEDWTDVMYETMAVHPFSWIYYLTFIFLTAFIFLNMMVGTVLEVMSQEHENHRAEQHGETGDGGEPASRAQIDKLEQELAEIKRLIVTTQSK